MPLPAVPPAHTLLRPGTPSVRRQTVVGAADRRTPPRPRVSITTPESRCDDNPIPRAGWSTARPGGCRFRLPASSAGEESWRRQATCWQAHG